MTYEEAMRLVMAARPRTVVTAGLKVRKMVQLTDRVPTLWAAVLTEGLMIHATRYREDIKIEIRSGDDVHLRRMFRAEDKRDMAELAELTLADWKTDHPTVTIDPTDDAVDELELAVSEVAEALAAEVERLRAELEEARATLLNERGEAPPAPHWEWMGDLRTWYNTENGSEVAGAVGGWDVIVDGDEVKTVKTAREGMRLVDGGAR